MITAWIVVNIKAVYPAENEISFLIYIEYEVEVKAEMQGKSGLGMRFGPWL